ncbi:hypothetical protein BTUL_0221g00090 [Botrytis tulipae]|uniref:Uncharacterized protein n=1 Tax=Botrytis tulipae TaxID=87230 RepID=A0A4Z1EC26_9HELO|nr:hypothetical protein BTUL_0221g00090 [Botrytis tulipae]
MSLNDYSLTRGSRGYGQLDEYGQPQRQSYGEGQPRESSSRNRDIQGQYKPSRCCIEQGSNLRIDSSNIFLETYQYGPDRSTTKLPPSNLTDSITPSSRPTDNSRLPPISSFLGSAAQPSYLSTQTSNTTSLRSPADFNIPAARSHFGTTSQSQHYPTSESRSREASYPLSDTQRVQESGSRKYQLSAPSQRSNTKHRGNEHTDSMHNFPARIPTSMQLSPPPSGRSEIELGNSSSRHARKEQSRRRHKAKERSKSYSSRPKASMPPQQPLQGYSECLRYHASVESPQTIRGSSSATEEMPADFDMECRLPGFKERISTNALFGACGTHHDQLSTWDFSYCEAERGQRSKQEGYFPNGQCRNKKISDQCHWCQHHKDRRYHWREKFAASDCGKDGKWFEGRHEGTADLPPDHGTSGEKGYYWNHNYR